MGSVALKLVFNLGAVRKNAGGKADRVGFQRALLWLFRKWPRTYLLNVKLVAEFTSLKELLNSAMFIVYEGELENDPSNYMLFSLDGQIESLEKHKAAKKCRNNRARRKSKKLRRLRLWSEFAKSESRDLF